MRIGRIVSLEVGAVFPTCEIGHDRAAIAAWVSAVEELGYSHVVVFDHVVGAEHRDRTPPLSGPYDELTPFHEPMVFLGYLAALTERVDLVTGILILPQRQAVLVAKQAAEVDLLTGGRLRLGIGSGWNYVEYEALGQPFDDRGALLDEQIELMRQLWSEPLVDFSGRFHRVPRAALAPRPTRRIPLWFGGSSPTAFRRAARIGDGFIMTMGRGRDVAGQLGQLRAILEEHRRADEVPIDLMWPWTDRAADLADAVALARAFDAQSLTVNTMTFATQWFDPATTGAPSHSGLSVDGHIDALVRFATLAREQ